VFDLFCILNNLTGAGIVKNFTVLLALDTGFDLLLCSLSSLAVVVVVVGKSDSYEFVYDRSSLNDGRLLVLSPTSAFLMLIFRSVLTLPEAIVILLAYII